MLIREITRVLENIAPLSLQEDYDNAGLLTGNPVTECSGVLVSLDVNELVVEDAIKNKCNLIVAHHPIIFKGLKNINGKNYVERTIIAAIKNDVAIYAIHTNLDNVMNGVNGRIADKLELKERQILLPKRNLLKKLAVNVPHKNKESLMNSLFNTGAGNIGNYSECSFTTAGGGTFRPGESATPFSGEKGKRHIEDESKIEVIFPAWRETEIINAMKSNHPYEEVAYDIYSLDNAYQLTGSGMTGILEKRVTPDEFLSLLKKAFGTPCIKFTAGTGKMIEKVALCGGAGSFLIGNAINSGADAYVTSDLKYHQYFDAENTILLADIGHYESEQFTQDLLVDLLREKFLNFAVLKTCVKTNPVQYFTS